MTEHDQDRSHRRPEFPPRIECVYLTCFRSEFSFLATTLHFSRVRMFRAESLDEADFLLTVTSATAFLSDTTFLDGTWRDALEMATELHPLAASLIVADPVDWQFLSDAYTRGACGVLWKPVDFIEAIERVRAADQAARDRAVWLAEQPLSGHLRPAALPR